MGSLRSHMILWTDTIVILLCEFIINEIHDRFISEKRMRIQIGAIPLKWAWYTQRDTT